MALPSVVTLGSLAFVVAAGAGYAVMSAANADQAQQPVHQTVPPKTTQPAPPPRSPRQVAPAPPRHPRDLVPHVLVVVFNNTGVSGLAADKATVLRDAGWTVAATDNWYGSIPEDTVYYPSQLRAAARKLARVLDISRLRPAFAPMQLDRLTVILATG